MADDDQNKQDQNGAAAIPDTDGGSLTPIEEAPVDPSTAPRPLTSPTLVPYDPRPHHDQARRRIAYWLLGLLTGLMLATFACFGALFFVKPPPTFDEFKSLVELILTPLLTLVSAATGFYFGSQEKG